MTTLNSIRVTNQLWPHGPAGSDMQTREWIAYGYNFKTQIAEDWTWRTDVFVKPVINYAVTHNSMCNIFNINHKRTELRRQAWGCIMYHEKCTHFSKNDLTYQISNSGIDLDMKKCLRGFCATVFQLCYHGPVEFYQTAWRYRKFQKTIILFQIC